MHPYHFSLTHPKKRLFALLLSTLFVLSSVSNIFAYTVISAETESVSAATEEQAASMDEIANASSQLANLSHDLQAATSKFKI